MKRVLLAVFDPPWLLLLLGWPVLIFAAMVYAWPSNMDEYIDEAPTPEMRLAVLREIRAAERRVVLEFAGGFLRRVAHMVPDAESQAGIARAQERIRERIEETNQPPKATDDNITDQTDKSTDKSAEKSVEKSTTTSKPAGADAGKSSKTQDDKRVGKRTGNRTPGVAVDVNDKGVHVDVNVDNPTVSPVERAAATEKPVDADAGKTPGTRVDKRSEKRKRSRNMDPGFGVDVNDKGELHVDLGFVDRGLATSLESKYGKGDLPVLDAAKKQEIYEAIQSRVRHFVRGGIIIILLLLAFPALVVSKIVVSVVRAFSSRAEQSEKVAQQSSLARQLTEARLAAMQAQIEPHFLFNTMASVQQLIETDPAAAAKMQTNLIKYLRGAVPQMRENTSTLAREVELSTAYLDILKIRMEDRLTYAIDVPANLLGTPFPPMMLPTLVENSIKHGLEPLTAGGEIRITAAQAGAKLRVCVADTGMGFAHQPGKGVGLGNVRERLTAMYGRNAQLIVEPNSPRGAKLTIEIPYPPAKTP
jgi:uncharacterized alkaline shock family protein YloU